VSGQDKRKFLLIIPDGAADRHRLSGRSPIAAAELRYTHFVAREGVTGLLQTLYPDLAKGSIVAQLGMLGWDPYLYYPHGRASCELLALDNVRLDDGDLVLRANLVSMEGRRLASYNGHYILSDRAAPLIERIRDATAERFPTFELYHNSDFRNCLVIRGAWVDPRALLCQEPHENEGREFDLDALVHTDEASAAPLVKELNAYVTCSRQVLAGEEANLLFPWSASAPLRLPAFGRQTGFTGKTGIVGCMDFLHGIAKAGGIDFYKVGNGRPDTDYAAKGAQVIELLESGYQLVICHINGPDEASHMGDLELKIRCLERIDEHIVAPAVNHFLRHPEQLGGLMIVPDHYTNHSVQGQARSRAEAHSIDSVPFALWNGQDRDEVDRFGEDAARHGRYGGCHLNHLELLRLLGVAKEERRSADPIGHPATARAR
jgi:2,3-bisphosphoglycerate-independent phosphoglycerate mutase